MESLKNARDTHSGSGGGFLSLYSWFPRIISIGKTICILKYCESVDKKLYAVKLVLTFLEIYTTAIVKKTKT
jgi:hypothetical protein